MDTFEIRGTKKFYARLATLPSGTIQKDYIAACRGASEVFELFQKHLLTTGRGCERIICLSEKWCITVADDGEFCIRSVDDDIYSNKVPALTMKFADLSMLEAKLRIFIECPNELEALAAILKIDTHLNTFGITPAEYYEAQVKIATPCTKNSSYNSSRL